MSDRAVTEKEWNLLPLIPEFIEEEHRGYLNALQAALENPKIRNIALSGRYGVGKSSILQELARSREGNVVELSLSTLAPLADEGLDDDVPKQAKTTTNRIQQEIVKQLLYREKPSNTPGSRFRRIERFSFWRELVLVGLAGITIAVIGLLTGWTKQIESALSPGADLGLWSHGFVLGVGVVAAGIIRWALYGRVHIRQFSAGAATVTLDNQSVSYFDQYLDEIVYFFEVSKHDIVIFEDIDRFNDARIFETLLALNTLLNAQRRNDKPIRFIYAIKDSIFDQSKLTANSKHNVETEIARISDPAQAETVRANRTKFFDLVIPVVPFITHRSAKNLAWEILEEVDSDVNAALTDLAARYIPDMRLLKNVHNEFIVFRDRIFSGAGEELELCKTELFAMMLYKCTHLADFEAISIGKSNIDALYRAERELVSANITRIQKEIRDARNKLATIGRITTESRSLGNNLLKHIKRTARSVRYQLNTGKILFNGKQLGEDHLRTSQFWQDFTQASNDPILEWKSNNNPNIRLEFPRSVLVDVLNNPLDPDSWNESAEERLNAEIEEHIENLRFLRQANMGDLIKRTEFTLTYDEEPKSFDVIARDNLARDGLAHELIRNGYINRNFTLYTATYHGNRVSAAAQNFIMLHVDRDLMDEHFELDGSDVEGVIRECREKSLADPVFYNIAILDHLLIREDEGADIMIRSLAQFGERQQHFIQAYLNSATERGAFIERFTRSTGDALNYLVANIELADSERLEIVSLALGSLEQGKKYRTNKAVQVYLSEHYADFPLLTAVSTDADSSARVANVFAAAGIQVSELAPLTMTIQQAFVEQDCYALSRENLAIALESDTELTLDGAQQKNKRVYQRLLKDLPGYLSAIEGWSPTIGAASYFISVVEDVLEADPDQLGDVIALASYDCVVNDIKAVSEDAWPHLAEHRRFPATFANVSGYIDGVGEIDAYLAGLIGSASAITNHQSFGENDREVLAVQILAADDMVLSAPSRASLVESLKLDCPLSVEMISRESGELFALLLRGKVIADSADNYAYLSDTDWPTREQFIEQSKKFVEYMTPELVNGDLDELLRSERVSGSIKKAIVNAASEYTETCGVSGLAELAKFSTQHGHTLTPNLIEKMAVNDVPGRYIVRLLSPNLNDMPYDQLAEILKHLGDDYPALTSVGWDQPKIPDTVEDRALLNKLKDHGYVVSKVKPVRGGKLKVWKRRVAG